MLSVNPPCVLGIFPGTLADRPAGHVICGTRAMSSGKRFAFDDTDLSHLPLPPSGERLMRDKAEPRLALRLRASGGRSWVCLHKEGNKTRKHTLGNALLIPAASARSMVVNAHRTVPETPDRASLHSPDATILDLMPTFLQVGATGRWKPGTVANMESAARNFILPDLGKMKLSDLTHQRVARWYLDVCAQTKGVRMALSTLSGLMLYAEDHGLRKMGSNPCKGLRQKVRGHRGGLLSPALIRSLWAALITLHDRISDTCDAVRLLILTGARRSEILGLEWDRIVGNRAVLPDSKTGPRVIWLNAPAQDILNRRRASLSSPFVFPAPCSDGPMRVIDRGWRLICREAGITGLRVHDLRHHFASVAVSNGIDLRVVGQLLGHRDIDSTLGYAHLASAALVQSASRVSGFIDGAMNGGSARTASHLAHKGDATHA